MPLNRPVLDSRRFGALLVVAVTTAVLAALTYIMPDAIPPANLLYMPEASALRDGSITLVRTLINGGVVILAAVVIFAINSIRDRGH